MFTIVERKQKTATENHFDDSTRQQQQLAHEYVIVKGELCKQRWSFIRNNTRKRKKEKKFGNIQSTGT